MLALKQHSAETKLVSAVHVVAREQMLVETKIRAKRR